MTDLILRVGGPGEVFVQPFAIAAAALLISTMALRELAGALDGPWRRVARYLNIAIVPLLLVFAFVIVELAMAFVRNPPVLR